MAALKDRLAELKTLESSIYSEAKEEVKKSFETILETIKGTGRRASLFAEKEIANLIQSSGLTLIELSESLVAGKGKGKGKGKSKGKGKGKNKPKPKVGASKKKFVPRKGSNGEKVVKFLAKGEQSTTVIAKHLKTELISGLLKKLKDHGYIKERKAGTSKFWKKA